MSSVANASTETRTIPRNNRQMRTTLENNMMDKMTNNLSSSSYYHKLIHIRYIQDTT